MFAMIILVVYKKPLPVDWLMVMTTSVVYVSCMAVSLIAPSLSNTSIAHAIPLAYKHSHDGQAYYVHSQCFIIC